MSKIDELRAATEVVAKAALKHDMITDWHLEQMTDGTVSSFDLDVAKTLSSQILMTPEMEETAVKLAAAIEAQLEGQNDLATVLEQIKDFMTRLFTKTPDLPPQPVVEMGPGPLPEMGPPVPTIDAIKDKYTNDWLGVDGVTMVGIGLDDKGQKIIFVGVEDESVTLNDLPHVVGGQVDGFPIEIRRTGQIKPEVLIDKTTTDPVTVNVGDLVRIQLDGNPTTGFEWQCITNSRSMPLQNSEYVPSEPELEGSGGTYFFDFKPDMFSAGHDFTIEFAYFRSWEGVENAAEKFKVTLHVNQPVIQDKPSVGEY